LKYFDGSNFFQLLANSHGCNSVVFWYGCWKENTIWAIDGSRFFFASRIAWF